MIGQRSTSSWSQSGYDRTGTATTATSPAEKRNCMTAISYVSTTITRNRYWVRDLPWSSFILVIQIVVTTKAAPTATACTDTTAATSCQTMAHPLKNGDKHHYCSATSDEGADGCTCFEVPPLLLPPFIEVCRREP